MKEWPSAELLAEVEENFPEAGVANVEEARVSNCLLCEEQRKMKSILGRSANCRLLRHFRSAKAKHRNERMANS